MRFFSIFRIFCQIQVRSRVEKSSVSFAEYLGHMLTSRKRNPVRSHIFQRTNPSLRIWVFEARGICLSSCQCIRLFNALLRTPSFEEGHGWNLTMVVNSYSGRPHFLQHKETWSSLSKCSDSLPVPPSLSLSRPFSRS